MLSYHFQFNLKFSIPFSTNILIRNICIYHIHIYHNIQVLIAKNVESKNRSLNQRKTRKFNKIKYKTKRNTSNEKKRNINKQEVNREFQPPRERYFDQEKHQMLAAENQAQRDSEVAKEINKTPQRKGLPTLKFSPDLKAKINKPDQEDKSASNANKVEQRTGLLNSRS